MDFEKVEEFFDRIFSGPEVSGEFFKRSNWGNGLASPKLVDRDSLPKFGIEGFDRILGVGLLMQELLKLLTIGARQWLYYGDRGFELRSHGETFKVVNIIIKYLVTIAPSPSGVLGYDCSLSLSNKASKSRSPRNTLIISIPSFNN